jgi:endonuclease III
VPVACGCRFDDGTDGVEDGVVRKTANVVLGNAFSSNEGIVVDAHVARLSHRLGLTRQNDPVVSSEMGMHCRPGALTGRLFQRAAKS